MDRPGTPGDDHRRPSAHLTSDDRRPRVCLERSIEFATVQLRLRDWPGLDGPIIHIPDPLSIDDSFLESLAATLPERCRLLSLQPRGGSPYQVDAADILALLDQFGFEAPVLVAEELGCVAALVVAAWHANRVAGLVLIEPTYTPPADDGVESRAMRDCPPDWSALIGAVACPILELARSPATLERVSELVTQRGTSQI